MPRTATGKRKTARKPDELKRAEESSAAGAQLARRIRQIDRILLDYYGEPPSYTGLEDPLDTLIRTVLSQNTSDVNSHRAFSELKARFPSWEQAAAARVDAIERAIHSGGISHQKAPRIKAILAAVHETIGDFSLESLRALDTGQAMDYLTGLPGVGPKTAAVVCIFNLGKPVFPVDTHVFRVSKRLGLLPAGANAEKAFALLDAAIPDTLKFRLHINLIRHGRAVCVARRPRCSLCPLNKICPRIGVTASQ